MTSKTDNAFIALWLVGALIAAIPALGLLSAAYVDGSFIPVTNDSFYHARRILDVAVNGLPLYEFDARIHVPEGSLLPWPWGYDYLMAMLVKACLLVSPGAEPMKVLAYIPTVFVLVNMGLFVALCRACSLPLPLAAIATIAFALLPLNQSLHGVGIVDHHFMELTFVLLTAWAAISFAARPDARWRAIVLGLALGTAPLMHTSLFLLQLPVLLGIGFGWLRGLRLPNLTTLAIALLVSGIVVALPSTAAQQLRFEYGTFSLFQPYIAVCTAVVLLAMNRLRREPRSIAMLCVLAAVLSAPILIQVLGGLNYIAGGQVALDDIMEVSSPWELWFKTGSVVFMTSSYSALIFLAPVLLPLFAWLTWRSQSSTDLMRNTLVVFALAMLLTQFRFHPFGSWAMVAAPLLAIHRLEIRLDRRLITAGAAVVVALSLITPFQNTLFSSFPTGLTQSYAMVHPMFAPLKQSCDAAPGIVLADHDDGHPIRYHTECSVIANNFLLTEQHSQKIIELRKLLAMEPGDIADAEPQIDYVLVHLYGVFGMTKSGPGVLPDERIRSFNSTLFNRLALDSDVPENFELLAERRLAGERPIPYVQLYRIRR
ncbi:MAG: hypothetical protein QNJ05_17040 [Woeseiaceae bacterium]|nr:hypothetical protein [Woeseiaceae bacterium]